MNHLLRPPTDALLETAVTLLPGTPTLERYRSLRLIAGRPFTIAVSAELDSDAEGVLVAHGGQESGYVLYVEDGSCTFAQNFFGEMSTISTPVTPGATEVRVDVSLDSGRWEVTLRAGDAGATGSMPALRGMTPFEGVDVGVDRRSPVSWELYERRGAFPFSGTIHSVTYTPGTRTRASLDALIEEARVVGAALE